MILWQHVQKSRMCFPGFNCRWTTRLWTWFWINLVNKLVVFCCPSNHRFRGKTYIIEKLRVWTWHIPEAGHVNTNYLTSSFRATDKEQCFPLRILEDVLIENWCDDKIGLAVSLHIVHQFLIIYYRFSNVMPSPHFNSPPSLLHVTTQHVSIVSYDEWVSLLSLFTFLPCCVPLLTAQPSISCVWDMKGETWGHGERNGSWCRGGKKGYFINRSRTVILRWTEMDRNKTGTDW